MVQDIDGGESHACVQGQQLYENSVPSTRFHREPKMSLESKA